MEVSALKILFPCRENQSWFVIFTALTRVKILTGRGLTLLQARVYQEYTLLLKKKAK